MAECISIGQRCPAATIIKAAGLRKAAYPFDWILSGGEGWTSSILDDDFEKFMNKELFTPLAPDMCGHKSFCYKFFYHKNPADNDEDYAYYERCIARFRDKVRSEEPVYLIHTHEWTGDQEKIVKELLKSLDNFGARNFKLISIRNTAIQFTHCSKEDYDGYKIKLDKTFDNAYLFSLEYHNNWDMLAKELKRAIKIVEES